MQFINKFKLKNINTESVTNMSEMFFICESLNNIDLSSFNTKNEIIYMSMMFYGCESLENLN